MKHWDAVSYLRVLLAMFALLLAGAGANAQDLEPRSYTNTPVGMKFLIAGYGYVEGSMAFDPSVPLADAQYYKDVTVLAYAQSFDAWGKSAKFDIVVPYSAFSGHALAADDQQRIREMTGYNDPRFRVSVNFYGAPALSLKEFADYRQDLIVGASLQVTAPLGQYDNSKLINIGDNRWSFKPELGISKAWDSWTLEIAPSATIYTDNNDFNYGGTLSQQPVYTLQGHIVHGFRSGIWFALDGAYFTGGRTTINGVQKDTQQTGTRAGLTVAVPVDRNNSIKFYASASTSTRTGTESNVAGIAWQYRWGGGY